MLTLPKPAVWPVIHMVNASLALENARIAARCRAEGVFLIQMDGDDALLDPVAAEIRRTIPGLKVGVNYLSLPAELALTRSLALGYDATWTDRSGVRSDGVTDAACLSIAPMLRAHPSHLFFGGVAFKYQPVDPIPGASARAARELGMIPTTSGDGTGSPPTPAKLHAMKPTVAGETLGVASGITPDNAYELGRFVTHVLVSTGIAKGIDQPDAFDERALQRLMAALEP